MRLMDGMRLMEMLMPPIRSEADARRLARRGGNTGYVLLTFVLFGLAANILAAGADDEAANSAVLLLVDGALIGWLAYRIRTGRGWAAGPALLALWIAHIALNASAATQIGRDPFNPIAMIVHLVLLMFVLNGVRGCLWLRRPKAPAPAL